MPRTADEAVQLEGWNGFRRALKAADASLPKELAGELQQVGRTHFEPEARRRAQGRTNPRVSTRTINSIGTARVQSGLTVYGGGRRAPEFYGNEFGASQRRSTGKPKGHTTQFPPRSGRFGRGSAGYFFYPAIRATVAKARQEIMGSGGVVDRTLDKLAKA